MKQAARSVWFESDHSQSLIILDPRRDEVLKKNQIQEATVVSTGYSGQFGGAAGGNINLHRQVREQRIPRQRAVLLERPRAECQ